MFLLQGVTLPIQPLTGRDRGEKTKQKIILVKFCLGLSLGRIRFLSFASVSNQQREFAPNTYSSLALIVRWCKFGDTLQLSRCIPINSPLLIDHLSKT